MTGLQSSGEHGAGDSGRSWLALWGSEPQEWYVMEEQRRLLPVAPGPPWRQGGAARALDAGVAGLQEEAPERRD